MASSGACAGATTPPRPASARRRCAPLPPPTLPSLEQSPLTALHVVPYSVRTGTTAAKLDGRNAPGLIAARARRLRALGERKRAAFAGRFDGAEAEVLVETTRDPQTG